MRDNGVSLYPFASGEGKKQFIKDDPLADKILHRLGFLSGSAGMEIY